jgi:hypothetical protein
MRLVIEPPGAEIGHIIIWNNTNTESFVIEQTESDSTHAILEVLEAGEGYLRVYVGDVYTELLLRATS